MYLQWCLKGIPSSCQFGEQEAKSTLATGIKSNFIRQKKTQDLSNSIAQLSPQKLKGHVNDYANHRKDTPYISLSAGCISPSPSGAGVTVNPAWLTAFDFATEGATVEGYVYVCWTVVSLKPNAELLFIADETRDLNQFRDLWHYHNEGEITAKLIVPTQQIYAYFKINSDLTIDTWHMNQHFVAPESVNNIREFILS